MAESTGSLGRARSLLLPVFAVDLRSLGLFRIGLAGVLLWDLFDRSRSIAAHYTDAGVLPVSVLPLVTGGARFSVHAWLSGSLTAQWALMALSFAAALALLAGFRSRAAAALSWYLLSSLQIRNPLVSWEGADQMLRILLLWSVLAPVGARFSLDARGGSARGADRLCTPATALLVLQVCAVYWITGMEKTGPAWRDGTALAHALRFDYFGSAAGVWLRQFDVLLAGLSRGSLALELLGPFLLFIPFRTWLFRLALLAAFWAFHLGILVTMSVGYFSLISMVLWLPLVPSQVWDALGRARDGGARPPLRTPWPFEAAAAGFALFVAASIGVEAGRYLTGRPWRLPAPVQAAAAALRIAQHWPMFSPDAPRFDFWPVLRGELAGGGQVDPFAGGPVQERQPESVGDYFPSFKWKIYFAALAVKPPDPGEPHPLWPRLVDHLCRRWNARHEGGERLTSVAVTLVIEPIVVRAGPGSAAPGGGAKRLPLLSRRCQD